MVKKSADERKTKKSTQHHELAAQHLTHAASLHRKAAAKQEAGDADTALQETSLASNEAIHGLRHGEEALTAQVEHIHLLMREASHRANNILALVQSIARQTSVGHAPEDFLGRFNDRIRALAANQDLLTRHRWRGAYIDELAHAQLAHFSDLIGSKICLDGPRLCLNGATAEALGLSFHELATNSGKYGALAVEAGNVDVRWRIHNDTFEIEWIESNGPPVSPPKRQGFGSTIITALARMTVGGEANIDYAPSGLTWRLSAPAGRVLETCE